MTTTTTTVLAASRSSSIFAPAGSIVSVAPGSGGSMMLEYSLSSQADIRNGVAVWNTWPGGTVSASTQNKANKNMYVRGWAYTAAGTVTVLDLPSDSDLVPFVGDWGPSQIEASSTGPNNSDAHQDGWPFLVLGIGLFVKKGGVYGPAGGSGPMAPYMGNVVDRGRVPNFINTSIFTSMSRISIIPKDNVIAPQPILPNWYVSGAGNASVDGQEKSPGAPGTFTAAFEFADGTFKQLKFGGAVSGIAPDGGDAVPDADPSIVLKKDVECWLRIFQSNPNGVVSTNNVSCLPGGQDGYRGTGATDQTMGGTVLSAASQMYYPAGILGMTTEETAVIIGDSIAMGQNDTIDGMRGVGMFTRAVQAKMACVNMAIGSDRATWFTTQSAKRRALIARLNPTRIYCNYGYNDINVASRTPAQLRADIATIAAFFPGKKYYHSELTPSLVNSTDFYATTGGQTTASATNAAYTKAVNTALRKNQISGVTASIPTAAYRTSEDANQWIVESNGRTITDAVTTAGSNVLTSASAAFTIDDDLKTARVIGAGPSGGNITVIMSYVNATTINMTSDGTTAFNASTTLAAGTAYLQAARAVNDGTHPLAEANRRFTASGAMAHTLP